MTEREPTVSPAVTSVRWGIVEVEGYAPFKDVKLYPGGARAWDWGETGTRHSPGVQPADVEEFLDRGAEIVVISTGMLRRLQVQPSTLEYLAAAGVTSHVLPTKQAVARYNELRSTARVASVIHSTC